MLTHNDTQPAPKVAAGAPAVEPPTPAANPFDDSGFAVDVTMPESHLIESMRRGALGPLFFDDPDYIADWISNSGGGTLESLAEEKAH